MTRLSACLLGIAGCLAAQTATADTIETATFSGTSQVEDLMLVNGNASYKHYNIGGEGVLWVGEHSHGDISESRVLLRALGLDSLRGQTIVSASVSLYYVPSSTQTQSSTLEMFELAAANAGWVEGTNSSFNFGTGTSSWSYKTYATTPWAGSEGAKTAGVDYIATLLDSEMLATAGGNRWITLDIPLAVVQGWIDNYDAGEKNPGLILREASGAVAGKNLRFHSSEGANSPVFTFQYVPEPTTAAMLSLAGLALLRSRRR